MKKSLLILILFFLVNGLSFAVEVKKETERQWLKHSYKYGKRGNDCLNIYYNYGTPEFTVNSDDPAMLKKLYDACTVGHEDSLSGNNDRSSLRKILKRN